MMASWISRIEQAPRLQNSDMMRSSSVLSFGSDTTPPFYYRWGAVYDTCSSKCKWRVPRGVRGGGSPENRVSRLRDTEPERSGSAIVQRGGRIFAVGGTS